MLAESANLCHDAGAQTDALRGVLAAHGVELRPFGESGARPPLVVFASAADSETLEQIAVYASMRPERLLVAHVREGGPEEDLGAFLAAGAADAVVLEATGKRAGAIVARLERWSRVDGLAGGDTARRLAVGASACWARVLRKSVEIALFSRIPLLLIGESGTGKEQIARLIHELDTRAGKANFVVLDCATVVPELAGSEFFGHEKGAFTGAAGERDGAFMLAHGGTLFLDEIGELPLPLQGQLLRVIQDGVYKRVGGNVWRHTTFRLVCATNRDLAGEVRQGRFREDLFHRISGWTLRMPPLRERVEDIVPLAEHFVAEYAKARGEPAAAFSDAVRGYLARREYPGNARELKHVVGRLADLHVGAGPIGLGDIAPEERGAGAHGAPWFDAGYVAALRRAVDSRAGLKNIVRLTRKLAIEAAAEQEGANVQRMADKLLVSREALYQDRRPR